MTSHVGRLYALSLALVLLFATDLDQRLLPDVLTLPVIPVAFAYALSGANPLVGSEIVLAVVAALAIPAVLYIPSIPFGAGAFGIGDVKLHVALGRHLASDAAAVSAQDPRHPYSNEPTDERPHDVHVPVVVFPAHDHRAQRASRVHRRAADGG